MVILHYKFVVIISLAVGAIRSIECLEKLVIDTDAGVDDAMAILLILQAKYKRFEVQAITCTYGNTYLDNVVLNVLKTLTIANRSDIPVYKGAEKPLLHEYNPPTHFGIDGLGDFDFNEEITAKVDESKHAVIALIDLVKQHPGEITLLSIAPLTNIATAIALEPNFLKYLKNHVILGSSIAGIGNVRPNVEFNFGEDPESNYITLNNTDTSILLPWETCVNSAISVDWRKNVLGEVNSTAMDFLDKAERESLSRATSWISSDTMSAALLLRPEIVEKSVIANVYAVVDGSARGSVLVDYDNSSGRPKNTKIIQSFNTTAFQELLLETFS